MPVEPQQAEDLERWHARLLGRALRDRSNALTELAEEFAQFADATNLAGNPGGATYGEIAGKAIQALVFALSNLGLKEVIAQATRADIARSQREASAP